MQVIRYNETEHRETIDAWCRAWEMREFPPHWLPGHGWIVPDVLALWVYQTDSAVLFVENVISSPDASPEQHAAAIDAIQAEVDAFARARGGAYVVGQSTLPAVWQHAKRNGYSVGALPMRQLVKQVEAST